MNLLLINVILATVVFVAAVGPLLWAIHSHSDELNVMSTPREHAAPALGLSALLETGH